jgi:hypothetical protein
LPGGQSHRFCEVAVEWEDAVMTKKTMLWLLATVMFVTAGGTADAQTAKELKTKKNTPVALVNLLNARPDCSSNMNPIAVPVIREKPTNGTIQMTILVGNVAASGNCPARKVPTITLIYAPKTDYAGSDAVTIDIENGNQTTTLNYAITVQAAGETL